MSPALKTVAREDKRRADLVRAENSLFAQVPWKVRRAMLLGRRHCACRLLPSTRPRMFDNVA